MLDRQFSWALGPLCFVKGKMLIRVFGRMANLATLRIDFEVVGAALTGEAVMGEKVFKKCKTCHFLDKEKNKTDVHFVPILGSATGIRKGNKYSRATMEYSFVLDNGTTAAYCTVPKKYVEGINMASAILQRTITSQALFATFRLPSKQYHPLTAI